MLMTNAHFWQEAIRVYGDKMLLLGLLVFLHIAKAPDNLQLAVISGLLTLINVTRWNPSNALNGHSHKTCPHCQKQIDKN